MNIEFSATASDDGMSFASLYFEGMKSYVINMELAYRPAEKNCLHGRIKSISVTDTVAHCECDEKGFRTKGDLQTRKRVREIYDWCIEHFN